MTLPTPGPGETLHAECGVVHDRHAPEYLSNVASVGQRLIEQLVAHAGPARRSGVVTTLHYSGEGLRLLESLDIGAPAIRDALRNPRAVLVLVWAVIAQPATGAGQ